MKANEDVELMVARLEEAQSLLSMVREQLRGYETASEVVSDIQNVDWTLRHLIQDVKEFRTDERR